MTSKFQSSVKLKIIGIRLTLRINHRQAHFKVAYTVSRLDVLCFVDFIAECFQQLGL